MGRLDLGLPSYMGRMIISGLTVDGIPADIYSAEGRSPPSRERKLWTPPDRNNVVYMDINSKTSVEEMEEKGGNPKLLLYDAMMGDPSGLLVVSNGFQTDCDAKWNGTEREKENLIDTIPRKGIYHRIKSEKIEIPEAIYSSLLQAGSEVDPIRTARIACARKYDEEPDITNIGIVIRPRTGGAFTSEDIVKIDPEIRLSKGEFVMFATYGVDRPPYYDALPPDISNRMKYSRIINLDGTTPEELLEEVWKGLSKDILVGMAAAMRDKNKPCGFKFVTRNMEE